MAEYLLSMKMNFESISLYESFDEKLKECFDDLMCEFYKEIEKFIKKCKSPIEQMLGFYLIHAQYSIFGLNHPGIIPMAIYPQYEIEIDGKKSIVDFLITVDKKSGFAKIVVECDGHEFHEKTKNRPLMIKNGIAN
jgi:hypothetical protein